MISNVFQYAFCCVTALLTTNLFSSRQREQLMYVRRKHIVAKDKRVATQHVKWRFVQSLDENREQYGLPGR